MVVTQRLIASTVSVPSVEGLLFFLQSIDQDNSATIANPGSDATQARAIQGVTGMKPIASSNAVSTQVDGHSATLGITTGAKVVTDATGTLQQYLRGLVTFFANALGTGTMAAAHRTTLATDDPAVATLGAVAGAKVITDANGTIQQYLRGLVSRWADALGGGTQAAALRVTLATDSPGPNTAGDVAHDAANTGNPVQIGVEAIAHGTNPTAVTAGDRTKLYANRAGVQFIIGGHPNTKTIRLNFTAAQTNVAVVTVAAGLKIVVTAIMVALDQASTGFPSVLIGFATATTPTTTGVVFAHPGLPAGGGANRGNGSGILGTGADDEDLRITTVGAATGNGVDVTVSYYTIES